MALANMAAMLPFIIFMIGSQITHLGNPSQHQLVPPQRDTAPLKHIFHLYPLADGGGINRKRRGLKLGRASNNRGIAGKAEAFFGQENGHIHFVVGIFIMDERNSICALCDTRKRYICGIARGYTGLQTFWILAAIGEKARIGGHADKDIALHTAQAGDVDFNRRGCGRGFNCAA